MDILRNEKRKAKNLKDPRNYRDAYMDKILSGKELCDQFFKALIDRDDIDQEMAELLKELYFEGRLTKDNILQELKILREKKDE